MSATDGARVNAVMTPLLEFATTWLASSKSDPIAEVDGLKGGPQLELTTTHLVDAYELVSDLEDLAHDHWQDSENATENVGKLRNAVFELIDRLVTAKHERFSIANFRWDCTCGAGRDITDVQPKPPFGPAMTSEYEQHLREERHKLRVELLGVNS